MTVKTTHKDTHGDDLVIYRGRSDAIFIDGAFDGRRIAWRGVFDANGAREIAKRLNDLADIIEGK